MRRGTLTTMLSLMKLSRRYKVCLLVGGLLLLGCAVKAVSGDGGWLHLDNLKKSQESLESLTYRLESENHRMRTHLRKLESDDAYLEKVVRERLGWVKTGEFLYRAGQDGFNGPSRRDRRVAREG